MKIKDSTLKFWIQTLIAILTAFGTAFGVSSCVNLF